MQAHWNLNTDLSLLERMGDSRYRSQAWVEFLERYTRLFFAWFRRWGIDPGMMEDVLQETMIRILGDIQGFEHQKRGSFRAWMRSLARNSWKQMLLDAERSAAKRKLDVPRAKQLGMLQSQAAENDLVELFDVMTTRELLEMAHSRVRLRVDSETWETYGLVAHQQKLIDEVVAMQKITITQVYNRLYRVRKLLKKEMEAIDGPAS